MVYGERIYGHSKICKNGTVCRLLVKEAPCQLLLLEKKTKLGMILRSTKQSLSCFTCLPAFNAKEKLHRRWNQRSHFIDEETEAQRY